MREAFCLASGPSLTESDVEAVRNWRNEGPARLVIVANTTFRIAPWADALYGFDGKWWRHHIKEVRQKFTGILVTSSMCHEPLGLIWAEARWPGFDAFENSGAGAIMLARCMGAERIYLLGYDLQSGNGRAHWHGDHPSELRNADSMPTWPKKFAGLARRLEGLKVLNCTRDTALTAFPRASLESVCASNFS